MLNAQLICSLWNFYSEKKRQSHRVNIDLIGINEYYSTLFAWLLFWETLCLEKTQYNVDLSAHFSEPVFALYLSCKLWRKLFFFSPILDRLFKCMFNKYFLRLWFNQLQKVNNMYCLGTFVSNMWNRTPFCMCLNVQYIFFFLSKVRLILTFI